MNMRFIKYCLGISCVFSGILGCDEKDINSVTDCEPDEHIYKDSCEKDSTEHCGEHGNKCAESMEGWESGNCIKKVCIATTCSRKFHLYNKACEANTKELCGVDRVNCSQEIAGWSEGTCEEGSCHVSVCQNGLHVHENGCETDDTNNCGSHDLVCESSVIGWKSGECLQATCTVRTCSDGLHVFDNTCERDAPDNCGIHGLSCINTVPGWENGTCTNGSCNVTQCKNGYHVDATTNKCALDTTSCCGTACVQCTAGLTCDGGQCRDQCSSGAQYCGGECTYVSDNVENCGECGHNCNDDKPNHAKTMRCNSSSCQIATCDDNSHLDGETCVTDSVDACGHDSTNCATISGWNNGTCQGGICVPSTCKDSYHLAQDDSGIKWCELNNALNCGAHGHACENDQTCIEGTCIGDVGGVLAFGNYNSSPIQWYVLKKDAINHQVMLLAMDILVNEPYNVIPTSITWELSTIRSWLNGYDESYNSGIDYTSYNFINTAFTATEKAKIAESFVPAHHNPGSDANPGNATRDKIFLLSITEVQNLLGTDTTMCTKIHCTSTWWLRTPGINTKLRALVNKSGNINGLGENADTNFGIRPALWLNY